MKKYRLFESPVCLQSILDTRMFDQHHKFDVDLLSDFLDAKLKHCSQMKLRTKCSQLCHRAFKI